MTFLTQTMYFHYNVNLFDLRILVFTILSKRTIVFGRQHDSFLLRLSAKSSVWILKSKVLAETVSQKLHCENKNSSFNWDCQLKLAFQTWNLNLLLRLPLKTYLWKVSSLHLAKTVSERCSGKLESSVRSLRAAPASKRARLKGLGKENGSNQLQPPNALFSKDLWRQVAQTSSSLRMRFS